MISYWFLRCVAVIIPFIPYKWLQAVAHILAWIAFDILRLRHGVVLENIRRVFGSNKTLTELKRMGRNSYAHFVLTVLEFFKLPELSLDGDVEFRGVEHMQKALAENRGVYILCAHLGNWEAMASATGRSIAPIAIMVKAVGGRGVDRFVTETREASQVIPIKKEGQGNALRKIKKHLSSNHIIGFMLDQARPGEPRIPFLGHPAKTNTTLASMWLKWPAPVIPGYPVRTERGTHIFNYLPPLDLSEVKDPDLEKLKIMVTQKFNDALSEMVLKNPEQYFWLHRRWK